MEANIFNIPNEFVVRYYEMESPLREYRTEYMRDRDRILYCTAFRRLAGKTQIYTTGLDDHKKNRLTHSLEVAQIARTIAQALKLNADLAEAMSLGHDMGHTPFGHAGERILNKIMIPESTIIKTSPFCNKRETIKNTIEREGGALKGIANSDLIFGFKHNLQSVRVASTLEDSYRGSNGENIGLNLTNYTLWGIMNHSDSYYKGHGTDYPNYQRNYDELLSIKGGQNEAWSFEGYIVKLSDDIAQWHHDLEDAMRGGAISVGKICEIILEALNERLEEKDKEALERCKKTTKVDRKVIADLSHIVVNTLVNDAIDQSRSNLEVVEKEAKSILQNEDQHQINKRLFSEYDSLGISIQRGEVITLSNKIKQNIIKDKIVGSVHHSRNVERMNEKGKYIIRKLFEAYYAHPQQLPDGPILHFMVGIGKMQSIDDIQSVGVGEMRMNFENEMRNPKLLYRILLMRRICDHIASMTERYAIEEYEKLYG